MSGVIKSQIIFDNDDKVHHLTSQPTEGIILGINAELRKDNVLNDLSFGRQVASIPIILWEKAKRLGYDLDCKDSAIAAKEIHRFLQSDLGKPCMVRDRL